MNKRYAIVLVGLTMAVMAMPVTTADAWCGTPRAEPTCPEFHPTPKPTVKPKPTIKPPAKPTTNPPTYPTVVSSPIATAPLPTVITGGDIPQPTPPEFPDLVTAAKEGLANLHIPTATPTPTATVIVVPTGTATQVPQPYNSNVQLPK